MQTEQSAISPAFALLMTALFAVAPMERAAAAAEEKAAIKITGGHETDARDHGRPVVLIGNALGVTPEVFREAFSRVRPAPAGTHPDPESVRRNKDVLLNSLARYGITNEQLDRVSDYYRYRPDSGRLWPTKPAVAYAVIKNGAVTSVVITDPGSGYSSPPNLKIPGHPGVTLKPALAFGRDLKKNGSIASIQAEPGAK